MDETWKPIPGFEGAYEVSDLGRVRSLPRKDSRGRPWPGRVLKPFRAGKKGYVAVSLSDGPRTQRRKVHQLVAEAFLPEKPLDHMPNHRNGDKTNNAKLNLEWMTASENSKHAYETLGRKGGGGHKGKFGANHHASRAVIGTQTQTGVQKRWASVKEAAEELGVCYSNVSRCCAWCQSHSKGWAFTYAPLSGDATEEISK
ncbi:NUMOD4 motif-containing HNH endonuclease [Burkholderia ubonensis]|uniref:NUMOD4 motif-containing HNH endonuclease n=1 Tax=Burkholderia ubonensis TaxID=101571 RepID=UPI0009B2E92B|nr:NUMOD4 motif-containing HNH endonuclease [Burkholderia ubonensis]